jgi:hypothetical protein
MPNAVRAAATGLPRIILDGCAVAALGREYARNQRTYEAAEAMHERVSGEEERCARSVQITLSEAEKVVLAHAAMTQAQSLAGVAFQLGVSLYFFECAAGRLFDDADAAQKNAKNRKYTERARSALHSAANFILTAANVAPAEIGVASFFPDEEDPFRGIDVIQRKMAASGPLPGSNAIPSPPSERDGAVGSGLVEIVDRLNQIRSRVALVELAAQGLHAAGLPRPGQNAIYRAVAEIGDDLDALSAEVLGEGDDR